MSRECGEDFIELRMLSVNELSVQLQYRMRPPGKKGDWGPWRDAKVLTIGDPENQAQDDRPAKLAPL